MKLKYFTVLMIFSAIFMLSIVNGYETISKKLARNSLQKRNEQMAQQYNKKEKQK